MDQTGSKELRATCVLCGSIIPTIVEPTTNPDGPLKHAPEGAVYVVDEHYRKAANKPAGWKNANLRTNFAKVAKSAGLEPWLKLFHALRSSRETELAQQFPIHVVTAWLGNTPSIALRHYLLTTDSDYGKAARM